MSETVSTDAETVTAQAGDPETILDALRDEDSRALIAATTDQPRTAKELADRCGLSLSATYRRLERLTAAGLLAEGTRVEAGRRPAAEYVRDFEGVSVDVDENGRLTVVPAPSVTPASE